MVGSLMPMLYGGFTPQFLFMNYSQHLSIQPIKKKTLTHLLNHLGKEDSKYLGRTVAKDFRI